MTLPWVETKAFQDQVVLIVGAGQGIGEGLARRFAEAGAAVVACDCIAERSKAIEESLKSEGLNVSGFTVDITRMDQIESLFGRVLAEFPRLDVLINSAGFNRRVPFRETDETLWDQTQNVNLKGPFRLCALFGKRMADANGGSIINVSSVAAVQPTAGGGITGPSACRREVRGERREVRARGWEAKGDREAESERG
ncbi:MAG: SDR family NAD(P)-dependent oxidoreductase, partial [Planctomycetaceae bacterium]